MHLHPLPPHEGGEGAGNTGLFPDSDGTVRDVTSLALTPDFLLYGTRRGSVHYFGLADWAAVRARRGCFHARAWLPLAPSFRWKGRRWRPPRRTARALRFAGAHRAPARRAAACCPTRPCPAGVRVPASRDARLALAQRAWHPLRARRLCERRLCARKAGRAGAAACSRSSACSLSFAWPAGTSRPLHTRPLGPARAPLCLRPWMRLAVVYNPVTEVAVAVPSIGGGAVTACLWDAQQRGVFALYDGRAFHVCVHAQSTMAGTHAPLDCAAARVRPRLELAALPAALASSPSCAQPASASSPKRSPPPPSALWPLAAPLTSSRASPAPCAATTAVIYAPPPALAGQATTWR